MADDFEEIHVQPLESPKAVALLKGLVLTAKHAEEDESVDFEPL